MAEKNQIWTEKYKGAVIGNYKINRLIGEGGMAAVFEASQEIIGNKVAIKILRPELSINHDIRERFKKEAINMASLSHPNIPKVIGFEDKPKQLAIIMELLEGEDLNLRIKREGALNEKEILIIFEQILSALQYAHEKGIVHRDIKPSNIFILPGNTVKILDFGIAKLFGEGETDSTKTGIQVGTPVYMSPEQVKGDKSIDHRSDIYSLGVTLYCACKGSPPYDKNTLSDFDIFNKIVFESLPTVEESTVFGQIILKACQKNREERFQSCNEWLDQLKHPERNISYRKSKDIFGVKVKKTINQFFSNKKKYYFQIAVGVAISLAVIIKLSTDGGGGVENNTTVDTAVITDTPVYKDPQNDVNTNYIYTEEDLRKYPSTVSVIPPEYQGAETYNDQIAGNEYNYTVVAKWEIDEDGTIPPSSIEILSGLECLSCIEEVKRAIKSSSGNWLPATINGIKVKCSKEDSFKFPKEEN
jgi:serine/threonine protein kinase